MKRLVMTSVSMVMLFGLAGEAWAVKTAATADDIPEDVKFLLAREDWLRQAKKAADANPPAEIPALPAEDTLAVTAAKAADNSPAETPIIKITTTPNNLNLGCSNFIDTDESTSKLTVNVESNFTYGSIVATISPLKRSGGSSISPEKIFVQSPATDGYVAMKKPVAISKPASGSNKISLNFKVETELDDPAGKYEGTLTFTVVPPS